MKRIKPQDLSLNWRDVGTSDNSNTNSDRKVDPDQTKYLCFTKNKCYTQNDCDTMKDCVTNIYCDTDGACKTVSCKCGQTIDCPTNKCADTLSKGEICCAETQEGTDCIINTKRCSKTEMCLTSKEVECETEKFCIATEEDGCEFTKQTCVLSEECTPTEVCANVTVLCRNKD